MKSHESKTPTVTPSYTEPHAIVAALTQEKHAHRLTATELAEQRAAAEAYRGALDDAVRHPFRLLLDHALFRLLSVLSRLSPPVPARMAARFSRSAAKRDPARFSSGHGPGGTADMSALALRSLPEPAVSVSEEWTARRVGLAPMDLPAKVVAFYLPQFHPIPENDRWWGAGFTEWRNVTRAVPQYPGHYQPHVPADLGFYDLRLPEVMKQQIDLAQLYGVGAFCFYFYWFGGRTLLERPLRQFLDNPDMEIEFCLCWANENWSRRWDGLDKELLIAQDHSPEDDIAFIAHVSEYLRDPRNIRIDGKPLLLLYRPDLLEDSRATAERWRGWCRDNGVGEIFLAYVQTVEKVDPAVHGFDAAVEFPPNNTAPPIITKSIDGLRKDFAGTVYDWTVYPTRSESYETPEYTLFRGTTPAWDNTARRGANGTIFHGSTPAGYRRWLQNGVIETARRLPAPDQRLVFVNAWNEWAEGAHLEPDARYGHAYLQATYDALQTAALRLRGDEIRRVAIVSHDAHLHGAQFLALNIGQFLRNAFQVEVDFILLGKGDLMHRYKEVGQVIDLSDKAPDGPEVRAVLKTLRADGCHGGDRQHGCLWRAAAGAARLRLPRGLACARIAGGDPRQGAGTRRKARGRMRRPRRLPRRRGAPRVRSFCTARSRPLRDPSPGDVPGCGLARSGQARRGAGGVARIPWPCRERSDCRRACPCRCAQGGRPVHRSGDHALSLASRIRSFSGQAMPRPRSRRRRSNASRRPVCPSASASWALSSSPTVSCLARTCSC